MAKSRRNTEQFKEEEKKRRAKAKPGDKRIGNQYWLKRSSFGTKLFESPEILWNACCEYFQFVLDNPWYDNKLILENRKAVIKQIPKTPPFTQTGLQIFLGIDENTWQRYGKEESYKEYWAVVKQVNGIIYDNKFKGAAMEFFNPNIIARDLGLKDRTDLTTNEETLNQKIQVTMDKGEISLKVKE